MNYLAKINKNAHTGLLMAVVLVYFSFPVWAAVANVALLLMLLFWFASGQWAEKWLRIRSNPGLWFALGLYLWMWVGIIYSDAPSSDVGDHLRKYLKLALMAVVVSTLSDGVWRRRAWIAYGAALIITLCSSYLNIWFQLPWSVTQNQGWNTDHTVFKDYISQGILMSMFIAISLGQVVKLGSGLFQKSVWLVLAVLGVLSITHLSSGRSAYLSLAAALFAFVFWAFQGWRRWAGISLVAIGLAGVFTTSTVMQDRVQMAIQEAKNHNLADFSSIGQRLYFAEKTMGLIAEKPLLGWGTGAYHRQYCRVADNDQWCLVGKVHPHNQILFIWVENGLIGLGLLLGMMLMPMWMTRNAPAHVRGVAAAYTGIFIVVSMTHGSLWLSTESHFHTLMGALIFAGYNNRSKS